MMVTGAGRAPAFKTISSKRASLGVSIPVIRDRPPEIFDCTTGDEKQELSIMIAIRLPILAPVIRAQSREPSLFISMFTTGLLSSGSMLARAFVITPPVNSGVDFTAVRR